MEKRNNRLYNLFIQTGLFSEDELTRLFEKQKNKGGSFVSFLIESGRVAEEKLLRSLSGVLRLSYVRPADLKIEPSVLSRLPVKVIHQYNIIPVKEEDGALTIATNDPFSLSLFDNLRLVSGKDIIIVLSSGGEISKAIKEYYGVGAETLDEMLQSDNLQLHPGEEAKKKDIEDLTQDASVVKFVNQIIREAHQSRATDIHIEPLEDDLRIRYRIDGVLHQTSTPAELKHFQPAVISRVKIMAKMDIAEKRLPQDGRINLRVGGDEIDIRVSTIPIIYGESVSMRLLSRGQIFLGLNELGIEEKDREAIARFIRQPHGIILVTGPTGCGKSTSLYAFLSSINSMDKRIITIEEPVEYELKGVNQIEVQPKIDLTFANGLRSILRQDPDIIMVGEIRDLETAEISIRAALTGHLVFSTLHTNDAGGAATRLLDMGIEPYLVTSSVNAIIAQRLVRVICPHCREEEKLEGEYLKGLGFPVEKKKDNLFLRGRGCEKCRFTGYRGRTGIYEVLILNEEINRLILERVSSGRIKAKAIAAGMSTLRDDGWDKVIKGVTTIEEVLRVTQEEEETD